MNAISRLMALTLLAGPAAAQVQTYDLEITMLGVQGNPSTTFMGSFTFNPGGTGFCTAAFCAPGVTPQFSNVNISDPLSIDLPGGAFAFTDVLGGQGPGGGQINLFDTYFGTPGHSSFVFALEFSIDAPLGGTATTIGLNNILFTTDFNVTGTWSCGGPDELPTPGVTCLAATLHVTTRPAAMLADLHANVGGVGPGKSLANTVALAQTYYAAGDVLATCPMLTAFVNEVEAQAGKKIGQVLDAKLSADAEAIETAIGCAL
jgi:hypothetical protein